MLDGHRHRSLNIIHRGHHTFEHRFHIAPRHRGNGHPLVVLRNTSPLDLRITKRNRNRPLIHRPGQVAPVGLETHRHFRHLRRALQHVVLTARGRRSLGSRSSCRARSGSGTTLRFRSLRRSSSLLRFFNLPLPRSLDLSFHNRRNRILQIIRHPALRSHLFRQFFFPRFQLRHITILLFLLPLQSLHLLALLLQHLALLFLILVQRIDLTHQQLLRLLDVLHLLLPVPAVTF